MVIFSPIWVTASGSLSDIIEGENINIVLNVQEIYVASVIAGQTIVNIGPSVDRVFEVTINGNQIGFTKDTTDGFITFSPLMYDATIYVYRNPLVTYSLLNGTLPNGISLSANGVLSGIVINDQKTYHDFTIRAYNGNLSVDRFFSFNIVGTLDKSYLNPATLPASYTNNSITYYDLGNLQLGQNFQYTIDILQKEFITPSYYIIPISNFQNQQYNRLPNGLQLTGNNIIGSVALDNVGGRYYFELFVNDTISNYSIIFSLNIIPTIITPIDLPLVLEWQTNEGSLGSINALVPISLSVEANSNKTVVYSLSPLSNPLPNGISLDSNGNLNGILYDTTNITYSFTVRASVGNAFIERQFSIICQNSYTNSNIISSYLLVDKQTTDILLQNVKNLIPINSLFRQYDSKFGIPIDLSIYIISGLNNNLNLSNISMPDNNAFNKASYYYDINLICGSYFYETIYDTSTNQPLYEIIFQKLYDPNDGAGGFSIDSKSNVIVYSVTNNAKTVYINSIDNIRKDLITKLGFVTLTPYVEKSEILPSWMNSFQLALPIAYLNLGQSKNILPLLENINKMTNGKIISFNRLMFNIQGVISYITLR